MHVISSTTLVDTNQTGEKEPGSVRELGRDETTITNEAMSNNTAWLNIECVCGCVCVCKYITSVNAATSRSHSPFPNVPLLTSVSPPTVCLSA